MKVYYYSENEKQLGPFTIEELKTKKITKNTMVWSESMEDWQKAETIPEIKEIIKISPPPMSNNKKKPPLIKSKKEISPQNKTEKKSYKKFIFIGIGLLVIIASTLVFILQNNNIEGNYDNTPVYNNQTEHKTEREKTPAELRAELKRKELNNPNSYLTTTYKLKYKVFSGKDEITGKIYNSATMASYKDIKLKITYFSNTDTKLGSDDYIIYKNVRPNSHTNYVLKVKSPSATKKIGVKVIGASPKR